MAKQLTKRQLIASLKTRAGNLAKERDALRDIIDEAEELFDCADSAVDELQGCIDKLSELL